MYHRTGAQRSFLELVTPPTNHTHNNYSMTAAASETTQDVVCVCVCVCMRACVCPMHQVVTFHTSPAIMDDHAWARMCCQGHSA